MSPLAKNVRVKTASNGQCPSNADSSEAMSGGGIAAIVIVLLCGSGLAVYCVYRREKRHAGYKGGSMETGIKV